MTISICGIDRDALALSRLAGIICKDKGRCPLLVLKPRWGNCELPVSFN